MVNSPNRSKSVVAVQLSRESPSASFTISFRSRENTGSLSENTNVAVSAGEKPSLARV
jgi:hypothetical protein